MLKDKLDQKRKSALLKAVEAFDLPGDIVSGIARVEVTGGREILVENHGGIIEYTDTLVRVNGGTVIIEIRGMALEITAMTSGEMRIRGQVFEIGFKY